jgi:signal transduction histidine kinase
MFGDRYLSSVYLEQCIAGQGYFAGIPRLFNQTDGVTTEFMCQHRLLDMFSRDYAYLGLNPETEDGKFYLNGDEYAREVVLVEGSYPKRSLLAWLYNLIGSRVRERVYLGNFKLVEQCTNDELEKSPRAMLVSKDLADPVDPTARPILKRGNIYNGPYCVWLLNWTLPGVRGIDSKLYQMYQDSLVHTLSEESRLLGLRVTKQEAEIIAQRRKMDAQGRFVREVTHQISGPVNKAGSYLRYVKKKLEGSPNSDDLILKLGKAEANLENVGTITKELCEFSDTRSILKVACDLNECVKITLDGLVEDTLQELVIDRNFSDGIRPVGLAPTLFNQVLINVVTNSVEAVKKRDSLKVDGDYQGKIIVQTIGTSNCAKVVIADNGVGVSTSDQVRIFEPFFTTKGDGNRGVGLSLSYAIMQSHGGDIKFVSEEDVGTRVEIEIPYFKEVV